MKKVLSTGTIFLMTIAIAVCVICNYAIDGRLTWAYIVISSIIFAASAILPISVAGKEGIEISLIDITVLIAPFLYSISQFVNVPIVFTAGTTLSIPFVVLLWTIYFLFRMFWERNKTLTLGLFCIVSMVNKFVIDYVVFLYFGDPICSFDSICTLAGLFIIGVILISISVGREIKMDK